jgi:CO dehydrogenase nickel-insertion accessory protein CooC1
MIISIWGCPDSGKTTFTAKLTKAIHNETGAKVIAIFADSATPSLPVLFPNNTGLLCAVIVTAIK